MLERFVDLAAPVVAHGPLERLAAVLGPLVELRSHGALQRLALEFSQPIRLALAGVDGALDYRRLAAHERGGLASWEGRWCRLDNVEAHLKAVRGALVQLCQHRGVPVELAHVTGYLHAAGASVPRHCDRPEIVAVQLFGHRRWRLAPNGRPPLGLDAPVPAPTAFTGWDTAFPTDALEVELEPGSILGVPSGWWHQTCSREPSFSVSFVIPSGSDGMANPTPGGGGGSGGG